MTTTTLIYRKKSVLAKLGGISETTLRRWMKDEGFPRPKQLGPRAVGWLASQVDDWLDKRPVAYGNASHDDDGCTARN